MQKKRFASIDVIKTIAILFVIQFHCTLFSFNFIEEPVFKNYFRYYMTAILSTCVPLFFFVNGYLLFGREFNLRKHLMKMLKFIVLTVIWGIITVCILQVVRNEYLSPLEFIRTIWGWKIGWVHHFWYMGALVCLYIFFPLLKTAYDTRFRVFLYFTVICVILTVGNTFLNQTGTLFTGLVFEEPFVIEYKNFFNIFNPFGDYRDFSFSYFCMGGLAYRFQNNIESFPAKKRNCIAVLCIIISCFGLFVTGLGHSRIIGFVWDLVWNGYSSVFTFINVMCIFVLALNLKKDIPVIRTVASNTMSVYFMHNIFIAVFRPLVLEYEFLLTPIFNIFFCMFIIAASLAVCFIMKKIPLLKKLV